MLKHRQCSVCVWSKVTASDVCLTLTACVRVFVTHWVTPRLCVDCVINVLPAVGLWKVKLLSDLWLYQEKSSRLAQWQRSNGNRSHKSEIKSFTDSHWSQLWEDKVHRPVYLRMLKASCPLTHGLLSPSLHCLFTYRSIMFLTSFNSHLIVFS